MKIFIIVAGTFFLCFLEAKSQGTPPQRYVPPVNSVPIFLDSLKLIEDFQNLKILKEIYVKLKRKKVGMVYSYGFEINTKGRADLKWPETNPRLIKINPFVEAMFKTYKWIPSHKISCRSCLVTRDASFIIVFATDENYISYKVKMSEEGGVGKRLFYGRILMN